MNDVIQKLKAHVIERVNAEDWRGAMNLLDAIITIGTQSVTVSSPPIEEQVPPQDTAPQGTSFDEERMQKFANQPANLE